MVISTAAGCPENKEGGQEKIRKERRIIPESFFIQ
jgi:hypothetical protein